MFSIDLLLGGVAARDGLLERVQVHAHQIHLLDLLLGGRAQVLVLVAAREQARVQPRVQRLHAPVHDLGEAGEVLDRAHGNAGAVELAGGAAGGDDLHAQLGEAAGELDDPVLVGDRQQRPAHAHLTGRRALHPGWAIPLRGRCGHNVAFLEHPQQPIPRPSGSPRQHRCDATRVLGVDRAARRARTAHGLRQQRVLERAQRGEHLVGLARVRQLDRALQDHRAGVDAGVDEVDGHAEHLHAVGERLLDRRRGRGRPAAARGAR